jgi:hypothetical protein
LWICRICLRTPGAGTRGPGLCGALLNHDLGAAKALLDDAAQPVYGHGSTAPLAHFGLWAVVASLVQGEAEVARVAVRQRPGLLRRATRGALYYADAIVAGRRGDRTTAEQSFLAGDGLLARANAEASMHSAMGAAIDPLAQDSGVHYTSSAIIGSSGLAGRRAPHAWVLLQDRQVSTLDLFGDRLTLLTGPEGQRWRSEAAELADEGVPIVSYSVAREFADSGWGRSPRRTAWAATVRCWSDRTAMSPGTARTRPG